MSHGGPRTKNEEEAYAIVAFSEDILADARRTVRRAEEIPETEPDRFVLFLRRLERIEAEHADIFHRAVSFNASVPVDYRVDLLPAREQLGTLILDFLARYPLASTRNNPPATASQRQRFEETYSSRPVRILREVPGFLQAYSSVAQEVTPTAALSTRPNTSCLRTPGVGQRRRAATPTAHRKLTTVRLNFNPKTDRFCCIVRIGAPARTKRMIRSQIRGIQAKFGWLEPITLRAKLIYRKLCLLRVHWDQALPETLAEPWESFNSQLPELENLRIPCRRYDNAWDGVCHLIGFCGATEAGYAAVVYLRIASPNEQTSVILLHAKSDVAPLQQMSRHSLQLCGAHLLAKLLNDITLGWVRHHRLRIIAFCDSPEALTWIGDDSTRWKAFVGNRIAAIQELLPHVAWRYVRSEDNSANCAARGMEPREILHHHLWWHGPAWLASPMGTWPSSAAPASNQDVLARERIIGYCRRLEARRPLSPRRGVRQLHLFIDDQDILRVGRRLAGALATHGDIRQRFWIPDGRNVTRLQLRPYNRCFIFEPILIQLLDSLSPDWVTAISAFITGVD